MRNSAAAASTALGERVRERGGVSARFEERDGGFDLLLGDRVILRHRIDAPAFRIAKGNPAVTMVRGNFRMEDAPSDERVPRYIQPNRVEDAAPHRECFDLLLAEGADDSAILRVRVSLHDDGATLELFSMLASHDRLNFELVAEADEHVWGGGEQMSYFDLRGRSFPMWTSEPGVGREPGTTLTDKMSADGSFAGGDYWTTNYPEPTFLSSRRYAVTLLNSEYSLLDFASSDRHGLTIWSGRAELRLAAHDDFAGLVHQLSTGGGSQPPLPDWAIGGAIVGLKDGANSFARLERIIAAGAAVSGMWCEDWCGIRQTSFGRRLFWDWQWNPSRYPDLPARIAELKARGIRFLGYVNPYLAVDGPQYAQAARLGYLAQRLDSNEPYAVDFGEFDAGVVDFTNDAAAEWFAEEIIGKQMLDFGIDGWMADFGEYLPVDLRLHAGDPMSQHNLWPVHWAKVNADAVASRGRTGDALFFMRAGYTGVQQYCPLLWAGDQSVDFSRHDGIGTVITAALSSGLVGNAYSHSDVGGYTSLHGNVRTAELMFRWYELGAFTPVMRTHEGNRPDDNLQIDSTSELLAGFVRWSRVHAALAPWVRHLCEEASATGLPAQRALFLHWPDDRETFTIQDQYLYGADLMVAPVIEEGAVSRRVYLPGDVSTVWRHVWSGDDFVPGWHDVAAPLGTPPVFYRPDSAFADLFASLPSVRDSA
jgi:alpha-glucosidase